MTSILKEVMNKVQKGSAYFFSDWQLNTLSYANLDFLRDSHGKGFVFFRNGYVEVTSKSAELHPYSRLREMNKFVWERNIIDRDFAFTKTPSVFNDFLLNTSSYSLNKDEMLAEIEKGEIHAEKDGRFCRISDYWSKVAAFGFMLHGYKDYSHCPVVICVDAAIPEKTHSEGGTGKSVYASQALSHTRNLLQMDGQGIDLTDRFVFQQVNLDTQIICFDDANYKFNFNALFQRTTGDFACEGKGRTKITIPFESAPKMIITTNHTLKGEGHSFTRRQHIIQFSDFYRHNKLVDVHGKPFFTAWGDEEWNSFYTFAINCIQVYLKEGLVTPIIRSYDTRKLLASIPEGFVEWCDSAILPDREYERDTLLADYKKCMGDDEIESRNFTEYIKKWSKHKGYTYNPKTNGKRDRRNGIEYIRVAKT